MRPYTSKEKLKLIAGRGGFDHCRRMGCRAGNRNFVGDIARLRRNGRPLN